MNSTLKANAAKWIKAKIDIPSLSEKMEKPFSNQNILYVVDSNPLRLYLKPLKQ